MKLASYFLHGQQCQELRDCLRASHVKEVSAVSSDIPRTASKSMESRLIRGLTCTICVAISTY